MLREAKNEITLKGILSEVNVREGDFTSNGTIMPYLAGELVVKVDQEINGVMVENDVPVNFYATKFKKNGEISKAYESIQDLRTNYISIASSDLEHADFISVNLGKMIENSFANRLDGTIRSYPQITANFFSKGRKSDKVTPVAAFSGEICIGGIKEEMDSEGIPTGRLIVQGIVPQYGGKVDVIEYIVAAKAAVDYISTNWKKGDTVKVNGKLHFSQKTEVTTEEVGFGEPVVHERTVHVSEPIITSGSPGGLDGDLAYDVAEIAQGLNERQARLAEKVKKSKEKKPASSSKNAGEIDLGF